jgi:hypothetical protein
MAKLLETLRPAGVVAPLRSTSLSKRATLRVEVHSGFGDLRSLKSAPALAMRNDAIFKRSFSPQLLLYRALYGVPKVPLWLNLQRPFSMQPAYVLVYAANDLKAVLRVREGRLFGLPTGYFRGGAAKAHVAVIAEPGSEDHWLKTGLDLLLSCRRAFLFLLDYDGEGPPSSALPEAKIVHRQPTGQYWQQPLRGDFEATIANLGRRTRRNLRYALAQARKHHWQFLPDLSAEQLAEAVAALRPVCTHSFSQQNANERIRHSVDLPGFFAAGLKNAEGRWLSCLVGTRSAGSTDVFWQLNSPDSKLSICTTLRSFLFKRESESGVALIRFIGGATPQMEHLCTPSPGTTISLARPGLRLSLLGLLPAAWMRRCSVTLGAAFRGGREQILGAPVTRARKAPAA